jgi:hypothetical protein
VTGLFDFGGRLPEINVNGSLLPKIVSGKLWVVVLEPGLDPVNAAKNFSGKTF